jgi:hypothetical protein
MTAVGTLMRMSFALRVSFPESIKKKSRSRVTSIMGAIWRPTSSCSIRRNGRRRDASADMALECRERGVVSVYRWRGAVGLASETVEHVGKSGVHIRHVG